jgi:hypothetical protein
MRHPPPLVGEVALGDMERLGVAVVRWRQPAHVGRQVKQPIGAS